MQMDMTYHLLTIDTISNRMAKLTETHLRVSVHMTYACVTQVESVWPIGTGAHASHMHSWILMDGLCKNLFFFMIIQTCSEGQIPYCRAAFNGSINQVGLHQYSDFLKYDN